MAKQALTAAQEGRLIRYLDQELLRLSGAFEARHSGPTARLPTLAAFLGALEPLLAFILAIPAAHPSNSLRVAYLLQLTGYIAPALDGYTLADEAIPALFDDTLARFDRGWVAVLRGDDWDTARGEPTPRAAEGAAVSSGALRTTDRVRLDALVREIKGVLAISLGLPEFVPLENDPFQQVLNQRDREAASARTASRPPPKDDEDDEAGDETGDEEMLPASGAGTPSLVSDASAGGETDDAMSVDTAIATPSDVFDEPDDQEDEEDGVEFEEVVSAGSAFSQPLASTATSSTSDISTAYVEPREADGSFNLHFTGLPPPTLRDGELSLEGGQTPFVAQQRGFDPDAEYPLSEEEGDPIGGNALTGPGEDDEPEIEDGIDDSTRDRVKHVFEHTTALLEELKAQAEVAHTA